MKNMSQTNGSHSEASHSNASETVTIEKPVPPTPDPRIRQWVLTVIVALGAGVGAKEALGSTMAAVAGGLSGVLASFVIDWLRVLLYEGVNTIAFKSGATGLIGRTASYLLYNPKGIRVTTVGITLILGALAAGLLDWSTGKPVSMAVASAWAFLGSQMAHLRSLPNDPASLTGTRETLAKEIDPPLNIVPTELIVKAETKDSLQERLKTVKEGSTEYYDILSNIIGIERAFATKASEQPKTPE